jgi:hypothetical protein
MEMNCNKMQRFATKVYDLQKCVELLQTVTICNKMRRIDTNGDDLKK